MREKFDNLVIGKLVMEGSKNATIEPEDSKKVVMIPDESILNNLCFIGVKNTGKGETVIPLLFKQHLEQKAGISIFTSRTETAYNLYYMAKKAKKKVTLLKPSCNLDIINFIYNKDATSEDIEKLINIPKLIDEREIMIVDMEFGRFSEYGILAAKRILLELQKYMDSNRHNRRHYVYLDDGDVYLSSIKNLLTYGDEYNFATILFLQTREQLCQGEFDYRPLIDSSIRNTILLQGLTFTDAEYYAKVLDLPEKNKPDRFFLQAQIKDLLTRGYGEFSFEIQEEGTFARKTGVGKLFNLTEKERKEIEAGAKRQRAKIEINWKEEEDMRMVYEKAALKKFSKNLFNESESKTIHYDFLKNAQKAEEESNYKEKQKDDYKKDKNKKHDKHDKYEKRDKYNKYDKKDNYTKDVDLSTLPSSVSDKIKNKVESDQDRLQKSYELNQKKQEEEKLRQQQEENKAEEKVDVETPDTVVAEIVETAPVETVTEPESTDNVVDDFGELPEEFGDIIVSEDDFTDDTMFANLDAYGSDKDKDENYVEDLSVEEPVADKNNDPLSALMTKAEVEEKTPEEEKEVIKEETKENVEEKAEEGEEEVGENSLENAFRDFFDF